MDLPGRVTVERWDGTWSRGPVVVVSARAGWCECGDFQPGGSARVLFASLIVHSSNGGGRGRVRPGVP